MKAYYSIEELINDIEPADTGALERSEAHWDSIAKPLKGLGRMEELITRIAGITGDVDVKLDKRCLIVFCGDNGVVEEGVAQCDSSVTARIVESLVAGTASATVMSKATGTDYKIVDAGVATDTVGTIVIKSANGTDNITKGPAMSRTALIDIILKSAKLVGDIKEEGYNIVALGEAGIGNTTTTAALAAVLLDMPVEVVTGPGSGLDKAGMERKLNSIRKAIEINKPVSEDPLDALHKLGGFDIAAMVGAYMGGAAAHLPVVVDGVIAAVAALIACRLCPNVRDYIIPSHMSTEPAMVRICEELGLKPVIDGGMHLGEGTGAVLLLPMLDTVLAVYRNGASFEKIQVEQYKKL